MLDKLLPPRLKKKPKKLQRQATFLDKPKEQLKKKKVRPRLLGTGHVPALRNYLRHLPGPDLREQVEVLHIFILGKPINWWRMASQKILRQYRHVRGLAVVGFYLASAGDLSLRELFREELFANRTTVWFQVFARLCPRGARVDGGLGCDLGVPSCPSHDDVGGFISDFEAVRCSAQVRSASGKSG